MNHTLVLNADANPMSVVPLSTIIWQKAICVVVKERATVLEEYDKWVIRSPSISIKMPSIIMLKDYQELDGSIEFSRRNVYLRDNYTCMYCGQKFKYDDLTFDHMIPRRDGGKTKFDNIVTSCVKCNQEKGHEYHKKPMRLPYYPSYWELAGNRKKIPITVPHEIWKDYLFWEAEVTVNTKLQTINVEEDEFELDEAFI